MWREKGRRGGEEVRAGFLEETAPELVFKERGLQQDRRVHSIWRVEWCFLPSLNKLLALLGQPHLPSLLIIQGTSHTGAPRKPSGSPPPPATPTGEPHVTASTTCAVCRLSPHGGPEMLQWHVCLSPANPWASSRCPAEWVPKGLMKI